MTGRGAWPGNGVGGTLKYKEDTPGPYYKVPVSGTNYIGRVVDTTDVNSRAVQWAVKYWQRALNRRMGTSLAQDGVFGPVTKGVVVDFQKKVLVTADGVIGPTTGRQLLCPDLQSIVNAERKKYPTLAAITPQIVCGTITQESNFDIGAVGYVDDDDWGIAQINGPNHPEYTETQKFDPDVAFLFVFNYYRNSVNDSRINTVDDMIASYNLGIGGASRWISQGRPEKYYPTGSTTPRYVWDYINTIKTACAIAPR